MQSDQTPFEAGQVWQYRTRPQEPESTLVVCKVETHPKMGKIVHIHVQGLRFLNPRVVSGFSDRIHHMPVSEQALSQSVTQLVRTGEAIPDFEEGYRTWQEQQGGVFTLPVDECVNFTEQAINQSQPRKRGETAH